MTAIHRRERFGVMMGGAVVATLGLSMSLVPAEAAPYCPANRVPDWSPAVPRGVRRRKECWWWGGRWRRRRICCWRWLTPHGRVRLSPIVH
jgi:hypothetical protein